MTDKSLPSPLVAANVDVRDLDGFMLNVERLMASELVALSSHEVVGACLFLWCRAWKQKPAASLPDDDRVIAAYSRLPAARYRKLKAEILRGFTKCSDGRLYHRVLAEEATRAFGRKTTYLGRREKDAERLRQWRLQHAETSDETPTDTIKETENETQSETRFVAEDTIRYGTVGNKSKDAAGPPLRDGNADDKPPAEVVPAPQAELFRRGKEVLGKTSGGLIRKVLMAKGENVALARAALEMASQAGDPREYLGAIIAGRDRDGAQLSARERGEAW